MNSVNPSEPKTMIHLEHPTTDEVVEIRSFSLRERITTMLPRDEDETYAGVNADDVVDGLVELVALWLDEQWPVIYEYGPAPKLIAAALAVVARR